MMLWRKPDHLKYTDLCIYIDDNVEKIKNPGEFPRIEDLIYNYLWLLVKALAIKKRMFNSFQDYDGYSFYAANRLYFALRKNLQNQGQVIKGKEIKPIKSCLNYTKALMYPMKIEYLRETYNDEMSNAIIAKKFDSFAFREKIKESIVSSQGADYEFMEYTRELFENIGSVIDDVLKKSPFEKGDVEFKKLKISLVLNCLNNLKNKKGIDTDPVTTLLWKLPKSMASYVKVLLKELGVAIKLEIMHNYNSTRVDEDILDFILTNPNGEFIEHDDE